VIAPEGEAGARMLDAIQALVDHRRAQQGAAPKIFRVPPAMDAGDAIRWRNDVLRAEDVPEDERPYYLLILGDLHEVSLELQHVLAAGALVGRLQCPTIKGFRDYAEKVVAREKAEPSAGSRALFYTVQDGTAAIQAGYSHLVEPCMKMTQDWLDGGKIDLTGVDEIPYSDWGPDDMLAQVGTDTPSVLLSLSHGLGAPRKGWRSPDQQRALQGALSMGLEKPLSADALVKTPFLPGGVWFCVACFAAGTPDASAFSPWLSLMADHGGNRQAAKDVLRSLPAAGERPFVAALPQTLLANPRGPLAIVGHMDLAWTFGFTDPLSKKSRASRMFSTLRALLAGSRVGVALDALMYVYRETNDDLTSRYQLQRDALARGQPDPVAPRALGQLWMQRNDLRGYVLLGDPATRVRFKTDLPSLQDGPAPSKQPRRARIDVSTSNAAPSPAAGPVDPSSARPPAESTDPPESTATALSVPAGLPVPPPIPPAPAGPLAVAATPSIPSAPAGPAAAIAASAAPAEPPPIAAIAATDPPIPVERPEVPMSTQQPPPPAHPPDPAYATAPPAHPGPYAPPPGYTHAPPAPPPQGAAPLGAMVRPRTLENPEIALRERAVLAMLRGDEAPRSIAVRFGLPLEEVFYWLDVYREAGRKALGG
jgi:hypothetical protein